MFSIAALLFCDLRYSSWMFFFLYVTPATKVLLPTLEVHFWCCSNGMGESLRCWLFPAQVPAAAALASCLQMISVPLHWSHPVCWIWYWMSLCVANGNVSALHYERKKPGDSHLFTTEIGLVGNTLWKTHFIYKLSLFPVFTDGKKKA